MKVKDHLGNEYQSVIKMCNHYGISRYTYQYRISKGLTVEQALKPSRIQRYVDHLGNEHKSLKAMAQAWGVPYATFYGRLRVGQSIEEALTTDDRF